MLTPTPDPNWRPIYTLEPIENRVDSYKLYLGRGPGAYGFPEHGLWLCTLSEFDQTGPQLRQQILDGLNNLEQLESELDLATKSLQAKNELITKLQEQVRHLEYHNQILATQVAIRESER